MKGQVLQQASREIEVRSWDEWKSSVSQEQRDVPAHDTNDPPRQPWVGAENKSFVCASRKGFGVPPCADQCENSSTCAVVGRANRCIACASPCRFPCLLDGCHKFGFLQVRLRDQRCVEIRSENEVPGMIAPFCYSALQDIDNTFSNFELRFLPVVCRGCSFLRHTSRGVSSVGGRTQHFRCAHHHETETDNHNLAECVEDGLEALGKQTERNDSRVCGCRG